MMFLKSKILYSFAYITILITLQFSVKGQGGLTVTQVNGVATATFTPFNCSPGVAILDWGDEDQDGIDCVNQNPSSGVQHQYQSCGTYTVTYRCFGIQNPPPPQTATVVVNIPTLVITQLPQQISTTDCGSEVFLSVNIRQNPNCGAIPGNVTISSSIPNTFTPSIEVIPSNSDAQINGNLVQLTIPGTSISTTPVTFTLRLKSKICALNTFSKIIYNITGQLGVGLGVQQCNSLINPPTQSSTQLEWHDVRPNAPCLQINKTTLTPSIPSGGDAQFQVTVTNTGTANAINVQVTDVIPPNFTVVTSPSGSTFAGGVITTPVPNIVQGLSWTGTYTLRHVPPVPPNPCAPVATFKNCAQAGLPNCEGYTTAKSCSEVQVVTAVLPPNPNFTVNEVDCNSFQFVSEDTGPGLTHSWSFGDGTTSSTDANPLHDYLTDGTYTVTHTVTRCGQTTTQSATVTVNCSTNFSCPCTTAGSLNIDAGAGTNISDIPQLNGGGINLDNFGNCIAISGLLIINSNSTIQDGTDAIPGIIKMQPGAMIRVNTQRSLYILESDISGCAQMWRSIQVNALGQLYLRNNTISDAEYAVDAIAFSASGVATILSASGNRFINNHIGIRVRTNRALDHILEDNFFYSSSSAPNTLLPKWSSSLPNYSSNSGYCGIAALNRVLSTRKNEFYDLRNGVISENCEYTSQVDRFTKMLGTPPFAPGFISGSTGIGILAKNGKLTTRNGIFGKLHTGIYTDNNPIVITDINNFSNITRAIFANRTHSANIFGNEVKGFRISGITINGLVPNGDPYNISRNVLSSNGSNFAHDNETEWAISISNATEIALDNASVAGNIIDITDNTGGIRLRNVRGWTVGPENIHTQTSNTPVTGLIGPGFKFENGGSHFIHENTSTGSLENNGYETNLSGSNTFCCNIVSDASAGFLFMGACTGTAFRFNNISSTTNCLRFTDMTRISPQPDATNQFLSGSGFAVHESINLQDILQSRFSIYDINQSGFPDPGDSPWFPSTGATPGLFDIDGVVIEEKCADDDICSSPPWFKEPRLDGQDSYAAGANTDNSIRGTTLHWESQRALYQKLSAYPDLLGQATDLDQFFSEQYAGAGDVGRYNEAQAYVKRLGTIPDVWATRLKVIADELLGIQNLIDIKLAELSTVSTSEDSTGIYYSANTIRLKKEPWLLESDSLLELVRNWQRNEARLLLPFLSNLPDIHTAMHNQKVALSAYTRYIAEGIPPLTSVEAMEIASIALQCPLEGGSAVYLARDLYSVFGGEQYYDDLGACGVEEREQTREHSRLIETGTLRVIPNPAGEQCLLRWDIPATAEGLIRIWGNDGRQVYQQAVPVGSLSANVFTAHFSNGLYYCQYLNGKGQVLTARLFVQH